MLKYTLSLVLLLTSLLASAQPGTVKGKVIDNSGLGVPYAYVLTSDSSHMTVTGSDGNYNITLPVGRHTLLIKSFSFATFSKQLTIEAGQVYTVNVTLVDSTVDQGTLKITVDDKDRGREKISFIRLKPLDIKKGGIVSDDIGQILATLPEVMTNSELSSQYSVRGGSFDENLVYVNGIQVYRPFLTRSGQQEGLSFVNTDLVKSVGFYGGGWQPRFGDKMSSVLDIEYKTPEEAEGSITLGLLGGSAHFGSASKNRRFSFIIGARQKSTQYLLNTLETNGEYLPKFIDVQSYMSYDLSKYDSTKWLKSKGKRTTISLLSAYARNRYLVRPADRTTNFGTNQSILSLFIAFDGEEQMSYTTLQEALKLTHNFNGHHKAEFYGSYMTTREREFQDLEGGYRLCDIAPDPSGSVFNQCAFERGVGTLYNYSRNILSAQIINGGYRGYFSSSDSAKNEWEWGVSFTNQQISDQLREYAFIDSSDFVTITEQLDGKVDLNVNRFEGYIQNTIYVSDSAQMTFGVRANYFDLNDQLLISPRFQYSWKPRKTEKDVLYKVAVGVYSQPPFYREMRDFDGNLNPDLKAQTSIHAIVGRDLNFEMWGRKFKFTSEAYYKQLYNIVPYDIDNVRLRYYANNDARGYVYGADFRVSGEFVKGEESWFSLGILSTREDVEGDGRGFIRRPTDQRINFGVFFQDHLPNNPSIKMNLNLVFGTGLPFGPPQSAEFRNSFSVPPYRRLDVGFSKLLTFKDREVKKSKYLESIYLALEVLNIIGAQNTISYIWIADVTGAEFAVPNTLSARFLNLKMIAKF